MLSIIISSLLKLLGATLNYFKGDYMIFSKKGSSSTGSTRGSSSHPGPGGNWPSTTGKPSGGGRGNGPQK